MTGERRAAAPATEPPGNGTRLRPLLLAVIALGLLGTGTELIAFEHYEDGWQVIPLVLIALALAMVFWNAAALSATSVRLFRVLMVLFVLAGGVGVVLHYRANLEFQREIDPTQSSWQLFTKAIHAKAPPPLAPGAMTQLGLLGLIWAYRHPRAIGRRNAG